MAKAIIPFLPNVEEDVFAYFDNKPSNSLITLKDALKNNRGFFNFD